MDHPSPSTSHHVARAGESSKFSAFSPVQLISVKMKHREQEKKGQRAIQSNISAVAVAVWCVLRQSRVLAAAVRCQFGRTNG